MIIYFNLNIKFLIIIFDFIFHQLFNHILKFIIYINYLSFFNFILYFLVFNFKVINHLKAIHFIQNFKFFI